jgi:hypothetical protein
MSLDWSTRTSNMSNEYDGSPHIVKVPYAGTRRFDLAQFSLFPYSYVAALVPSTCGQMIDSLGVHSMRGAGSLHL